MDVVFSRKKTSTKCDLTNTRLVGKETGVWFGESVSFLAVGMTFFGSLRLTREEQGSGMFLYLSLS